MNLRCALSAFLVLLGSTACASAAPKSLPNGADFSVAGITLNDARSSRAVLGRKMSSSTDPALIENNEDMPHGVAVNKSGTEVLTFYFHYGGEVMAFSEFKVSRTSGIKLPPETIKLPKLSRFVTGKGVKLGLSEAQLIKILGPPQKRTAANGAVTLEYAIKDPEGEAGELLGYSSDLYYGTYTFKAGKLIELRFGFHYP